MNQREADYWNEVGQVAIDSRRENIYKRAAIARFLLQRPPIGKRVLEIGCGKAFTAAAVSLACCGKVDYVATELGGSFAKFARDNWGFTVMETDIKYLPDGPFDQVWALDTLEHVKREDRPEGYKEISRVLAEHGIICINVPLGESHHVDEFEHGIMDQDVTELAEVCKARVVQWEKFVIPALNIPYAFVVLKR